MNTQSITCMSIAHAIGAPCNACAPRPMSIEVMDVIAELTRNMKHLEDVPLAQPTEVKHGPARVTLSTVDVPRPSEAMTLDAARYAAQDEYKVGGISKENVPPTLVGLTHEEIIAERCRRSLSYFVRTAWLVIMPGIPLHWNWHLEQMCRHIQGMLEEWIKRANDPTYEMKAQNLAINCPPRSLKSTILSVCAPAWMWIRWPSFKFLFLSANPRVAQRDAHACTALIEGAWYTELRQILAEQYEPGTPEHKRVAWTITRPGVMEYTNSEGGVRIAMGFTAVVVGLGGDGIFIDDPNDTKKVMAEAERAKINDTWDLSLCNRVNSYTDSIRVMIMQRCHEMDLTGHWHESMPDESTIYLVMPLEYDPEQALESSAKSPFGYRDPRTILNECIHPARFSPAVIASELKRLGPYGFAGQMNQKPTPLEGGAFKRTWWRFCHVTSPEPGHQPLKGTMLEKLWRPQVDGERVYARKPHTNAVNRPMGCDLEAPSRAIPWLDALVISVDATFGSLKDDASRVGLMCIGLHGADRYVLEDRTVQRTFPETCDAIRGLKKDFPSATYVLIERKANGEAVISTLTTEIGGCVPIDDNENWMVRANAMLPYVAGGNWFLLDGAQWVPAFITEFSMFPNGAHDDRIDTCSQVSKYFSGGGGGRSLPDW